MRKLSHQTGHNHVHQGIYTLPSELTSSAAQITILSKIPPNNSKLTCTFSLPALVRVQVQCPPFGTTIARKLKERE